ncbi:cold-shock protein [Kitasatospora sp. NPDC096128]|uniref:cold-shock protein n=1 Tax=Kitasatospora sp. NPDC096128 TaxID=3155547 RepID=UPI003320295E
MKWFDKEKGYGFITPDEQGPEVFAHYSEIEVPGFRELTEGQRVEFEISPGPKGPQADRIRLLADRL